MQHIAIDLGSRRSQVCVRDDSGRIVQERAISTEAIGRFLRQQPRSRVLVETCAEGFAIADVARRLKHEVRVVPSTLVHQLGVGHRGLKTDVRDARAVSEMSARMSHVPSVHVPSERSRELKRRCGAREAMVETRTKLSNVVRGWARTMLWRIPTGGADNFARRVREGWAAWKAGASLPSEIESLLVLIEAATTQIKALTAELRHEAQEDEVARRLMTAPGVGPMTALRFVALVDEPERFASTSRVGSYVGLVPGEDSSSDKKRRLHITKAGSGKMRWTLVQAATTAMRTATGDPLVQWAYRVALRRGKKIAAVALARRLATVMLAMWRDGSEYEPRRTAMVTEVARP